MDFSPLPIKESSMYLELFVIIIHINKKGYRVLSLPLQGIVSGLGLQGPLGSPKSLGI